MDTACESGVYVIRQSIEVNTQYFQSARLMLDYWPDRMMDDARACVDQDFVRQRIAAVVVHFGLQPVGGAEHAHKVFHIRSSFLFSAL